MSTPQPTSGHQLELLINGEAFFPRVNAAIDAARWEILLETFILFDDGVGRELQRHLIAAAQRGVTVHVLADGYGSLSLSQDFVGEMSSAGINFRYFDPRPTLFWMRTNPFRRLHRKLLVVDAREGYIGGINFSDEHLLHFGPEAKQDYAVAVRGPAVAEMRRIMRDTISEPQRLRRRWPRRGPGVMAAHPATDSDQARVLLVTRDNAQHRNDIERHYLAAIRSARHRIYIANAYFFPGYRLLQALRRAAHRGVDVRLILQGKPDMPIAQQAAAILYRYLLSGGVHIYEYCERPLHGKVAAIDEQWSTIGSSNLDPLSLSLNLEANLMIWDRDFNHLLAAHLETLMHDSCKEISAREIPKPGPLHRLRRVLAFHFLRRFPHWAGLLPAHAPRLMAAPAVQRPTGADAHHQAPGL